jgi:hypothetical protein
MTTPRAPGRGRPTLAEPQPALSGPVRDAERIGGHLSRVRGLSTLLDSAIRIPGTNFRIGLDPIIGLVPGVGDLATGAMGIYVLTVAAQAGVSRTVLVRMLANLGLDALVGGVPLLGDLFDASFKANNRNVALLESALARPVETKRASKGFLALLIALLLLVVVGGITLAVLLLRALLAGLGALG